MLETLILMIYALTNVTLTKYDSFFYYLFFIFSSLHLVKDRRGERKYRDLYCIDTGTGTDTGIISDTIQNTVI